MHRGIDVLDARSEGAGGGRLFVVVPVFKEHHLIEAFLESWGNVVSSSCTLLICNGNPGDETSIICKYRSDFIHRIVEVRGNPSLFWGGLVALGLREVGVLAQPGDMVLLTNIDVTFEGDPVAPLQAAMRRTGKCQMAAIARTSTGRILSSGVQVRSWSLSINRHVVGDEADAGEGECNLIPVTYLPTRFVLFPASAVMEAGLPAYQWLPHYCCDYEYTNRLRTLGYTPYVCPSVVVNNVEGNTGFKTFQTRTTFYDRLSKCMDVKATYNLRSRFWFVWLAYPGLTRVPGVITHFFKILLEVLFGVRRFIK